MFQALLKDVVEGTDGAIGSLLMDRDGIALDSYSRAGIEHDMRAIGVELGMVLRSAMNAARMLDAGRAEEITIVAENQTMLVRVVNEHYFAALSLSPGGNIGKARYMLRTRVPELISELA
ncbi:MAG: roadblock/LC7 domain-containing protein [Myxococcales bacterium]|nr:roadblock/LC7 domain-containing protein [Myxococcales bacterium]